MKWCLFSIFAMSTISLSLAQTKPSANFAADRVQAASVADKEIQTYFKDVSSQKLELFGFERSNQGIPKPELQKAVTLNIYTIQLDHLLQYEGPPNDPGSLLTRLERRAMFPMTYANTSEVGYVEVERGETTWTVRSITPNSKFAVDLWQILKEYKQSNQDGRSPAIIKIPALNHVFFGELIGDNWMVRILGEESIADLQSRQNYPLALIVQVMKQEAKQGNGLPR